MALVAGDLQATVLFAAFAARAEHAGHAAAARFLCAFCEPAARPAAAGFFVAVPPSRADARAAQATSAVVAIGTFGLRRGWGASVGVSFSGAFGRAFAVRLVPLVAYGRLGLAACRGSAAALRKQPNEAKTAEEGAHSSLGIRPVAGGVQGPGGSGSSRAGAPARGRLERQSRRPGCCES
jgi:hypothetical protein